MAFRTIVMTAAAMAVAASALPSAALAHPKKHKHRHPQVVREVYYEPAPRYYAPERGYYAAPPRYRSDCRSGGTTGLIVGGAAGALLGREVDGGRDRTAGTVVGAAAGALLGREIDRKDRC